MVDWMTLDLAASLANEKANQAVGGLTARTPWRGRGEKQEGVVANEMLR